MLFTRRTDRVQSHKGQVSFPGGASDEGETTPEQTALREAEEEIGMRPADVQVLGRLSQLITISSFRVTPVVGVIPFPYAFKVANIEVARVFTIPLLWLSDRNNYWEFFLRDSERSLITYHPYDGELLWGATARMTVTFLKTIGTLGTKRPRRFLKPPRSLFLPRYNPPHGHISYNSRSIISHSILVDAGLYQSFPHACVHHSQFA